MQIRNDSVSAIFGSTYFLIYEFLNSPVGGKIEYNTNLVSAPPA